MSIEFNQYIVNTTIHSKNSDQFGWHYIFMSNEKSRKAKLVIGIEVPSFLVTVSKAHVH